MHARPPCLLATAALRAVVPVIFLCAAPLHAETNAVPPAPDIATNLPLRGAEIAMEIAPKLADAPLPASPQLRLLPIAAPPAVAEAQLAVIRAPDSWRNWAALALARYAAGDFEKSFAAAKQMRAAAATRNEPLPLAADELYRKCRRAADALALQE